MAELIIRESHLAPVPSLSVVLAVISFSMQLAALSLLEPSRVAMEKVGSSFLISKWFPILNIMPLLGCPPETLQSKA